MHSSLATVPAWAPIGQYSDCYRGHLGEDVGEVAPHPKPMVEVLAHHRGRWGYIDQYEDFLPLLTFDQFDAEEWARLAVDAGMGYTVFVAKHHDGWCWWDAPGTERTMVNAGPQQNVLAQYAAACERNNIVFGTYYSMLDWADARDSADDYLTRVLRPQVADLVERYGSNVLWGDGDRSDLPRGGQIDELFDLTRESNPDLVLNDRWGKTPKASADSAGVVRTFEYSMPDDIIETPWELCRGIGQSFSYNRAERAEHHMSGFDIVSLLTEVVAKGGNLLLGVGPDLDGSIPELQSGPLRDAGEWVRNNHALINESRPWTIWGDEHVRYLSVDGVLHAIDLSGRGHFAALDDDRCRVDDVQLVRTGDATDTPLTYHQDADGLHIDLPRSVTERFDRHDPVIDIAVYRVETSEPERPIELFTPNPRQSIPLGPLLSEVSPGDIVQLGDGTYSGPVSVPPGIVVRGLGPGRTFIDGAGDTAVQLQRNARLEHLTASSGSAAGGGRSDVAVEVLGQSATILGCEIQGHVVVRADGVLIRAVSATGVTATGSNRLTISRCQFTGTQWDIGIHITGGEEHEIDSCEIHDHLCAIRVVDTTGTLIRGNNISARWWGVHLHGTERAHVYGNHIDHTMRAVDVDGGTEALIDGNAVADGDSGCIVQWGASGCQVSGNCWERCRIGLLAWEATGLHQQDNLSIDLHEPDHAVVSGP